MSAYLHSATMVKAGVYLIARMTPVVGVDASVDDGGDGRRRRDHGCRRLSSVQETDLKRILATHAERARRADNAARRGTREAIISGLGFARSSPSSCPPTTWPTPSSGSSPATATPGADADDRDGASEARRSSHGGRPTSR